MARKVLSKEFVSNKTTDKDIVSKQDLIDKGKIKTEIEDFVQEKSLGIAPQITLPALDILELTRSTGSVALQELLNATNNNSHPLANQSVFFKIDYKPGKSDYLRSKRKLKYRYTHTPSGKRIINPDIALTLNPNDPDIIDQDENPTLDTSFLEGTDPMGNLTVPNDNKRTLDTNYLLRKNSAEYQSYNNEVSTSITSGKDLNNFDAAKWVIENDGKLNLGNISYSDNDQIIGISSESFETIPFTASSSAISTDINGIKINGNPSVSDTTTGIRLKGIKQDRYALLNRGTSTTRDSSSDLNYIPLQESPIFRSIDNPAIGRNPILTEDMDSTGQKHLENRQSYVETSTEQTQKEDVRAAGGWIRAVDRPPVSGWIRTFHYESPGVITYNAMWDIPIQFMPDSISISNSANWKQFQLLHRNTSMYDYVNTGPKSTTLNLRYIALSETPQSTPFGYAPDGSPVYSHDVSFYEFWYQDLVLQLKKRFLSLVEPIYHNNMTYPPPIVAVHLGDLLTYGIGATGDKPYTLSSKINSARINKHQSELMYWVVSSVNVDTNLGELGMRPTRGGPSDDRGAEGSDWRYGSYTTPHFSVSLSLNEVSIKNDVKFLVPDFLSLWSSNPSIDEKLTIFQSRPFTGWPF